MFEMMSAFWWMPWMCWSSEPSMFRTVHRMTKNVQLSWTWFFITCLSPTHVVAVAVVPGQISLEEFIEGAERDPWVMEQLQLDLGPCEWFMEQQQKKKSWPSLYHLPCFDTILFSCFCGRLRKRPVADYRGGNGHSEFQEIVVFVSMWQWFLHFQVFMLFVFYLPPTERTIWRASYTLSSEVKVVRRITYQKDKVFLLEFLFISDSICHSEILINEFMLKSY